jgi:hypothetical protein
MKRTKKIFSFHLNYFILAIFLFGIEVLIALYAHDKFIRPIVGDVLVVIWLYCLVKSFINSPVIKTAVVILIFSFVIEILQYFQYVQVLGLGDSTIANILLGNYFAWEDLAAYAFGILIVIVVERSMNSQAISVAKR